MINAAGAFVYTHNALGGRNTKHRHVYSKGIHLLVPRVTESEWVLAFFADNGRLFFVIPMGNRSCIGATDTRVEDPNVYITQEDRDFVSSNINACLKLAQSLTQEDVIAERCGVRPLAVEKDDNTNTDFLQQSRKHISIFGGKLTDCLNVGEEIAEELESMSFDLPRENVKWYGEPDSAEHQRYIEQANRF